MTEFIQQYQWGLYLCFFLLQFVQEDVSILGAASACVSGGRVRKLIISGPFSRKQILRHSLSNQTTKSNLQPRSNHCPYTLPQNAIGTVTTSIKTSQSLAFRLCSQNSSKFTKHRKNGLDSLYRIGHIPPPITDGQLPDTQI